ncbi:MAG: hypothetical protein IPK16_30360, partial [Anaerolineales bacterium]|nr:hypothetical protein [Anaerolineales bacterium]
NRAGVAHQPYLPVWLVLENNSYVIVARDNSDAAVLEQVPDDPSGVPSHTHPHSSLTNLDLNDDHPRYLDAERGDTRYFLKGEHLDASAGVGDAGKPIVLTADGDVDATMVPDRGQPPGRRQ